MPDVKDVIKSLETAVKNFERYSGDEYGREYDYARVGVDVLENALALLKAQEPMVLAGAELTDAELIEAIRKAPLILKPNVDAAPVVRCRDCKHAQMTYDGQCKYCDFWQEDGGDALYLDGDFYCAAGERRIRLKQRQHIALFWRRG